MSHKLTAAGSNPGRAKKNRAARRGAQVAVVGVLVLGLIMSVSVSAMSAMAGVGGGGTGGGGGGGGASDEYWLFTGDSFDASGNPTNGWGQTSIDTFATAMEAQGRWATSGTGPGSIDGTRSAMNSACTTAINQAIANSGGTSTKARVVQVGVSVGQINGVGDYYMGWGGMQSTMTSWYQGLTSANYWQGELQGYDASALSDVYNTFLASIPAVTPRIVCVAMNDTQGIPNYDLSISTDKSGVFALAGSTNAVRDSINASPGSSSIRENVNAVVTLRWGGVEGTPASASKTVSIANSGTTASPVFSPSDFGWASWPSGDFWFDVSVAKQGRMNAAVSHAGQNDPRESWSAAVTLPRKVLTSGAPSDPLVGDEVLASGMFYNAEVTARTNGYSSSMTINDTIGTDKVWIGSATADDSSKAYVNDPNGVRVAGATIAIVRAGGTVKVSGTVTNIPDAFQAQEYTLVVPTYVLPTKADYTITDDSNVCYTAGMVNCIAGNSEQTRKVTAAPDKVWVLDENGALTEADPAQTNQQGADNKVFLMGDDVSAVVNGRIPAKLAEDLSTYKLIDDWTKAGQYVDFTDASKVKVFAETTPGSGSYVSVTNQFSISINGTVTTATAQAGFLATTKGLAVDRKMKLIVSGAFRTDYDTDGSTVVLHNNGSEVWNNETIETNEPPVYTWTPNPNKQVLGSADESGDKAHDNIDGTSVWPGQKLEYSIGVDLRIPAGTARGVKSLAVEDVYDPFFTPDKSSIEFWDSRDAANPKPVPRANYTIVVDEAANQFTATFTDEWLATNVSDSAANSEWLTQGWLTMRFTGTVDKEASEGATVRNQAFQTINGARTTTEVPTVEIPTQTPDKEGLNTDLIDIDGKTVVEGDVILYRLTLDANPGRAELAYNVHKLGMVDDFDEEYLGLDAAAITVTEKVSGVDVTDKFNVEVTDGVAYVFAKQIDTADVYGGTIAGDPQPSDLAAYDQEPIKPLEQPIIDQTLLGKQYWITLATVVTAEKEGHVIENEAVQNIQNTYKSTPIISNPLKDIDPVKDVVVSEETKDDSINQAEVRMNSVFNYRLDSSEIPANRAYKASQWSLSDTFDKVHDQYTGIWAIYSNTDVYEGATLIFEKGDLLADSAAHESEPWNDLFAVTFDEASYIFNAAATQKYLDLVETRPDLANAFSVYTKMVRIAPAEKIENKVTESYNNFVRDSNIVWTFTPEFPEISVETFTLSEGIVDGDRDDVRLAYAMTEEQLALSDGADGSPAAQNGVEVGIRFSNAGDVPLVNISVTNITHDDFYGELQGFVCAVLADPNAPSVIQGNTALVPDENGMVWVQPATITELGLGEAVDCRATLRTMAPGMTHGNTVLVAGESVFTQKAVKAGDTWFATAPSAPAIEVASYTLDEGLEKGDRDAFADALELTPEQAKNGVRVAFDVSNTGDEPLGNFSFEGVTHDATTGEVVDVKWFDLVVDDSAAVPDLFEGLVQLAPVDAAPSVTAAAVEGTVEIGGKYYTERPFSELTELAVGQTALLVGTLTGVEAGTGHSHMASVTADAVYSGTPVNDSDPWNAKLAAIARTGAVTGDPLAAAAKKPELISGAMLLTMAAALAGAIIRRRLRIG